MKMSRISVSLRKPLKDEIGKLAKRLGITQSSMAARLLETAVDGTRK